MELGQGVKCKRFALNASRAGRSLRREHSMTIKRPPIYHHPHPLMHLSNTQHMLAHCSWKRDTGAACCYDDSADVASCGGDNL